MNILHDATKVSSKEVRLEGQAASATLWSGIDVFLRQGLQFAVSIILARLLTPEEFGTVALLALFVGVAGIMIDSGFSSALIQRQNATKEEESAVFWFNAGMGAVAASLLCLASSAIAAFFDAPVLVPLTCVIALNLFISSLGSVHTALLSKALNFKTQMKVGAVASAVSGATAVVMAWRGAGVWALAGQTLVASVTTVTLLWAWHDWRPLWTFSLRALKPLFSFGGFFLLSALLDTIYGRVSTLIIGKLYSVGDLGQYNRAWGTQQLPANALSTIMNRVAFPAFSAHAQDKELLSRATRKVLRGLMFLNTPAMFGLMAAARPAVEVLFGPQWLPCVPILQVLCLYGLFWPLHLINLNVLMAQGYSNLFFRLEVAKKAIGVGVLLAASPFGILAMAWSQVVLGAISFVLNAHYTGVFLNYSSFRQMLDTLPFVLLAVPMAGIVWLLPTGTALPAFPLLCVQLGVGAALYLGTAAILRLETFREAWTLGRDLLRRAHTQATAA